MPMKQDQPTNFSTTIHNGENQMDDTEAVRRQMLASGQPQRDLAEAKETWDTQALGRDFEVIGFMAPFIVVKRKSDGAKGSLEFTHNPRVYFNFVKD